MADVTVEFASEVAIPGEAILAVRARNDHDKKCTTGTRARFRNGTQSVARFGSRICKTVPKLRRPGERASKIRTARPSRDA